MRRRVADGRSNAFNSVVNPKSEGKTILLVEQDVQKSLSISKRGYVLENREIIFEGRAEDLLKNGHIKENLSGLINDS